ARSACFVASFLRLRSTRVCGNRCACPHEGLEICPCARLIRAIHDTLRRQPMFTKTQSHLLMVLSLSLSLVPIKSSLNSQSPAQQASHKTKIQLSYHVKAIQRDS